MIQLQRVVCPVDLSEFSRHALDHALALAEWYEAELTVLHVVTAIQPLVAAAGIAGRASVPLAPEERSQVEIAVRHFVDSAGGSKRPVTVLIDEGSTAKTIVRHAQSLPADLLVIGTHGRSGFEQFFIGSIADRVLRTTSVPVMTVPPPVVQAGKVEYKTILCPIDFSDAATRALEYALRLAEETDARLVLLHVLELLHTEAFADELGTIDFAEFHRELMHRARARLAAAVPQEARLWCTPEERVVMGKAYRVILEEAAATNADVIVMGVHGRGALKHLFGSTAHHVTHRARCPVLTLRG